MRHFEFHRSMPFVAILTIMSLAGCSRVAPPPSGTTTGPTGTTTPPKSSPTSRPISMISPVEFFSPEQKRLAQHLSWQTGCFQIEYSGPEAWLGSKLEVWEQGKLAPHSGSFSTSRAGTGEISISARQDASQPNTWRITRANSTSSATFSQSGTRYSSPSYTSSSTRLAQIKGPIEMMRGEEVAIWALMVFQTDAKGHDNYHPDKSVAEQAKAADWALVLKVALDPPGAP